MLTHLSLLIICQKVVYRHQIRPYQTIKLPTEVMTRTSDKVQHWWTWRGSAHCQTLWMCPKSKSESCRDILVVGTAQKWVKMDSLFKRNIFWKIKGFKGSVSSSVTYLFAHTDMNNLLIHILQPTKYFPPHSAINWKQSTKNPSTCGKKKKMR